jgi:hypothetical protein
MVRSSRSIAGLPGAIGEQRPVTVEVEDERVDGEQGGDRQGDGYEAAVELIPVVRVPAVLPAERLAGVTEGEPENDGTDEDVLDGGLELARAPGRDHDAPPAGPHAEHGHGHLAPDEQQAHPQRDTAPDGNVVQIVPGTRDPVDGNEGGEQEQLVGDGIEQLAEVGHLIAGARQIAVIDVAHRGDQEDEKGDELGPVPLDERQQRDDRGEADPDHRDDVGDRPHGGCYPRVLTTLLLIALRVSKTPSPVRATASK